MCPFCLATAAVIAGSATGTGGVTAFIAGTIMKRNQRKILPQNEAEEVRHGNGNDGVEDSEDGVAY
jgi:hypothetical protein